MHKGMLLREYAVIMITFDKTSKIINNAARRLNGRNSFLNMRFVFFTVRSSFFISDLSYYKFIKPKIFLFP